MSDMTLHRWKYDEDTDSYICIPLPKGGVQSNFRCGGCGIKIGFQKVLKFFEGNIDETIISAALNFMAWKGMIGYE